MLTLDGWHDLSFNGLDFCANIHHFIAIRLARLFQQTRCLGRSSPSSHNRWPVECPLYNRKEKP
jgi:hypothetical protein